MSGNTVRPLISVILGTKSVCWAIFGDRRPQSWPGQAALRTAGCRERGAQGDCHDKLTPFARVGAHVNTAAVMLNHDLITDGQTQTRALPNGLGGEKGVKQVGTNLGANTISVVDDVNNDSVCSLASSQRNGGRIAAVGVREFGAESDRVDGIAQQIHENLIELACIAINLR